MRGKEHPNSGWTRVALITVILFSSILISAQRGSSRNASGGELAARETVAPLAALFAVPLRKTEGFFGSFEERKTAVSVNAELREEIAILRERQSRYDNLAFKVARYEAILGADNETDVPLKKIAARAISETDGPFVRSLLLNVGTRDGVSIGNPVLSTEGLVGHVINTGPNTTRVLRLSDLNSRIAVASARSDATAILAGDNTARPNLSFINQREEWEIGDRVISSGDDGALPRGLDVGEVVRGDNGELRVSLSSHGAAIDWVWVSPFQNLSDATIEAEVDAENEPEPEAEAEAETDVETDIETGIIIDVEETALETEL